MVRIKSTAERAGISSAVKNICGKERELLLDKIELLDHCNQKLHFEGKVHFGKNVKEAHRITDFFLGKIKEYISTEEKVIFPLIETHLPQHGVTLLHFRAEHKTLLTELSQIRCLLQSLVKNMKSSKRLETGKQIHQRGIYVSHLLRHHLKSEGAYLCEAIDQGLPPSKEYKKITSPLGAFRKS